MESSKEFKGKQRFRHASHVDHFTTLVNRNIAERDASPSKNILNEGIILVDDKEIAAAAVKLVISSSRKSFICLCTKVALILKQNMKFKRLISRRKADVIQESQIPSDTSDNKSKFLLSSRNTVQAEVYVQQEQKEDPQKEDKKVVSSSKGCHLNDITNEMSVPCYPPSTQFCSGSDSVQLETIESESDENVTPTDIPHKSKVKGVVHFWKKKYLKQCEIVKHLEDEVQSLRQHVNLLESKLEQNEILNSEFNNEYDSDDVVIDDDGWNQLLERLHDVPLTAPVPLLGCKCSRCEFNLNPINHPNFKDATVYQLLSCSKPLLQIGDIVLVPRDLIAHVSYIGHIDEPGLLDTVFVGLTLEVPGGFCDGVYRGRRYFLCDKNYGMFLPINWIELIIKRASR